MPGKNKNPMLGWHPPAELSAWIRAEAARRDCTISALLTEAVTMMRAFLNADERYGREG